jgi:hypothetical protein
MTNKSYPSESSLCLSRRRRVLGLLVVAAVLALAPTSVARPDAAAAYGVPASVAADCSVDVTRALLSWFSSVPNGSVLSFGRGACYRIEGTLELRGRRGLTFEGNGATFRSLTAPDDQRALWRVVDSSRIAFHNLSIVGSYATGGKFDANLQHAHGIDLRGTAAEIAGVSISDVAGDGVYFGRGWSSALNRSSGSVHDSRIARVGRNAISITAGNDIRVERVNASAIGFIAFDVEPNVGAGWGSRRVTFDNNQIGAYHQRQPRRQSPTGPRARDPQRRRPHCHRQHHPAQRRPHGHDRQHLQRHRLRQQLPGRHPRGADHQTA